MNLPTLLCGRHWGSHSRLYSTMPMWPVTFSVRSESLLGTGRHTSYFARVDCRLYFVCFIVGKNAIKLNGGRLMFRVHLIRGQNRKLSCAIHQVVPAMLFLSLHNCEIITCWIFVLATAWPAVRTYNCVTDGSTLVLVGLLYFCFCHAFGF